MRHLTLAVAAMAAATSAQAAGIERASTPISVLFEEGNHVQLSFSIVNPSVSGDYPAALGGGSTGNMSESYTTLGFAYKHQFTDRLSALISLGQPYGADASYTQGAYTGLAATWNSTALTGLMKYQFSDRISAYGGARVVQSDAQIAIPAALIGFATGGALAVPYTATGEDDTQVGWVAGAAYEVPDIALRVSLTYESEITHSFATTETLGATTTTGTTNVTLPQSVTLDFQTGVAADTLVFGSVKWAEWSKWEVRPPTYGATFGQEITGFDNDTLTWTLGVGRRLNDQLSIFARAGYESAKGGVASRLSPTDGRQSLGIGGTFDTGQGEITAGIEYVKLGNAVDSAGVTFQGNEAVGFGVQYGMTF
jgi:long-subunit fatty acid transport protein